MQDTRPINRLIANVSSAKSIFIAAFITQFCMGYEVLLRISAATKIKGEFFDVSHPLNSGAMIGEILGVIYLGFAISNLLMAPFIDLLGIRKVHIASIVLFAGGTLLIANAQPYHDNAYMLLWGGSLIQGIAWGWIEAALNPLIVSIYPKQKVPKLNLFFSAFALGMLIAAPTSVLVDMYHISWRIQVCLVLIPAIIALCLALRLRYPPSERVTEGVSLPQMFKYTFGRAAFYVFLFAMLLTAATEMVPSNWMDLTLTRIVGIEGFWLVAFVYTVQIAVRLCTGFFNRYIGSSGIMFFGAAFAAVGLLVMSQAATAWAGMLAALLFGMGTSVMWPTMLGSTSERFPKGGSLAIGVMASCGMLSSYTLIAGFGVLFDQTKVKVAGGAQAFEALKDKTPEFDWVMSQSTTHMFELAALFPIAVTAFFAVAWYIDAQKRRKGEQALRVKNAQTAQDKGVEARSTLNALEPR